MLNEKFGLKPAKLHEAWTSSWAFIGGNSFREEFFLFFIKVDLGEVQKRHVT